MQRFGIKWFGQYVCLLVTTFTLPTEVKDFLLMATSLSVRGIPLNLSLQEDVILPLSGPGSSFAGYTVDYDGNDEVVFFNDRSKGLIYKSNLDGTGNPIKSLSQKYNFIFPCL